MHEHPIVQALTPAEAQWFDWYIQFYISEISLPTLYHWFPEGGVGMNVRRFEFLMILHTLTPATAAHAGYVGRGMLSAAVAGAIFASPNVSQIRRAINLVHNPNVNNKGVLLVVKNYTGDVLHFGLAAEQARASLSKEEGDKIRLVVVGDDVAVGRRQGGLVGRRYETGIRVATSPS